MQRHTETKSFCNVLGLGELGVQELAFERAVIFWLFVSRCLAGVRGAALENPPANTRQASPTSNSSCPLLMQVGGFAWENCGDKRDPVVLQSLSVAPDPITIPGSLRVSAAVKSGKTMGSPLKVSARRALCGKGGQSFPKPLAAGKCLSLGTGMRVLGE